MLDISIPDYKKIKDKKAFLSDTITITEKLDGTKLSLIRLDTPYDKDNWQKNWIVAYKGNIISPEEVSGISSEQVQNSKGFAQYKFVINNLEKAHKDCSKIKRNTEIFCEFVMKKSTLTREYENFKHGLYIIGKANIKTYKISGLKIFTSVDELDQSDNEYLAKVLRLNLPPELFHGKAETFSDIIKGTNNSQLKQIFSKYQKIYDTLSDDKKIEVFVKSFLEVESELGGKSEGIVIKTSDGKFYKALQTDQHDTETRIKKKISYGMLKNKDEENKYWENVKSQAIKILNSLHGKEIPEKLRKASEIIYKEMNKPEDFEGKNPNKTLIQLQDDLFTTFKILLTNYQGTSIKNALFIGKLRVLTIAHYMILKDMIQENDNSCVALVTGSKYTISPELRRKMIETVFPDLLIIDVKTGNLAYIQKNLPFQINRLYCGTDRVNDYRKYTRQFDIEIIEIKRDIKDGISATKALEALKRGEIELFKAMTPEKIHIFIDDLKKELQDDSIEDIEREEEEQEEI